MNEDYSLNDLWETTATFPAEIPSIPNWVYRRLWIIKLVICLQGVVGAIVALVFLRRGKLFSRTTTVWLSFLFLETILVIINHLILHFYSDSLSLHHYGVKERILSFVEMFLQAFDSFLLLGCSIHTSLAMMNPNSYGQNSWRSNVLATGIAIGVCFLWGIIFGILLSANGTTPENFHVLISALLVVSGCVLGCLLYRSFTAAGGGGTSFASLQLRGISWAVVSMIILTIGFLSIYTIPAIFRSHFRLDFLFEYYQWVTYFDYWEVALRWLGLLFMAEFRQSFKCQHPPRPLSAEGNEQTGGDEVVRYEELVESHGNE